jgi:hypothetical protein
MCYNGVQAFNRRKIEWLYTVCYGDRAADMIHITHPVARSVMRISLWMIRFLVRLLWLRFGLLVLLSRFSSYAASFYWTTLIKTLRMVVARKWFPLVRRTQAVHGTRCNALTYDFSMLPGLHQKLRANNNWWQHSRCFSTFSFIDLNELFTAIHLRKFFSF